MYRLLVSVILFLTSSALPQNNKIRGSGGQDATDGQYPFIVTVLNIDGYELCNGAILDTQWVLTTANCVGLYSLDDTIQAGTYLDYENASYYGISQVILHEEFDAWTYENDIALVQLNGSGFIYNTNTQPIAIGEAGLAINCSVISWGLTDSFPFSNILQANTETTIDLDSCKMLADNSSDYYYIDYLVEEELCTVPGEDMSLCTSDVGSPLVCGDVLVGLFSFSFDHCGTQGPDVFTRVADYQTWIQTTIAARSYKDEGLDS